MLAQRAMDRAVIFDVDGVLADSFGAHRDSWMRAAREAGIEMTEGQFATTFGRTSREIIRHFWGDGLTEEQMREIEDEIRRRLGDMGGEDGPRFGLDEPPPAT